MIDREHVKNTFYNYTEKYDSTNGKIKLKIEHTYRVADLCDEIARSIELSEADIDLAWLIGMLHDIARFEQIRIYNTFIDKDSINHAYFGADLLFGKAGTEQGDKAYEGRLIDDYVCELSDEDMDIVEKAVRYHSDYRIPNELSERESMFCNIIRDADKIDILRANLDFPMEVIYNVTSEELNTSPVTKEVLKAFFEHGAVKRELKKTPIDNLVGHISLVYELVYPESYNIVKKQGYLEQMLNYKSENPDTVADFKLIRDEMHRFLDK